MENENVNAADNNVEVAAPQEQHEEFTDTSQTPNGADNTEIKETKRVSERINKIKADYEKQLNERNAEIKKFQALESAIRSGGYEGNSIEDLTNGILASVEGVSVEEIIKRKSKQNADLREAIENAPEVIEAKRLLEEAQLQKDLNAIKAVYPDISANSPLELGDRFVELMATGAIDALTAYRVVKAEEEAVKKEVPKSMGSVNNASATEKDFYTPEEVDSLPKSAYDDPKIFKTIRKSMLKW